jgi:hypothetical protein
MATRLQSAGLGVRIPVGLSDFPLFQQLTDRPWSLLIPLFSGYRGTFPGLKRSSREVNQPLTPSSAEFKIEWSYISTHSVCFHVWTGNEHSAIDFIFAHGSGQISNTSNASYNIVRTPYGAHCKVFLQMIPGTFRNIGHWLSILSLHRHFNMFFASCECSKYHAVEIHFLVVLL